MIFLDSSMVEHSAVNRVVVGSSPTRGVFLRPHGQAVKTSPFHGGIMGSIPVRVTTLRYSRMALHSRLGVFLFVRILVLVFIAKQQGSRCCSKSLISVTAEVLILNLWSLSREFGFFAALLFFFVKDKCVGDCLARPCLCFLEHMAVDVRCR